MPSSFQLNNRDHILSLIKSIAGQVNILAIPRLFLDITGDLVLAAMLSQLIYWSDRTTRSDGFVFKSASDWAIEVGASDYSVRKFKKLPFIETKVIKAQGSPTTHYRVRFDDLIDWICRDQQMDLLNSTEPIVENNGTLTEIPTQTTHQTKDKKGNSAPKIQKNSRTSAVPEDQETPILVQSLAKGGSSLSPSSDFHVFLSTLAGITSFDQSIKSNAARLGRASRQLIQAGYTTLDLDHFLKFWKTEDWRWEKDRQLPTPEDVLSQIARSKSSKRKYYSSWVQ